MQTYKMLIFLLFSETHVIDKGTITFPNLTKADTAMYECVADNGVNNIYQTAYLDVQGRYLVIRDTLILSRSKTLFSSRSNLKTLL